MAGVSDSQDVKTGRRDTLARVSDPRDVKAEGTQKPHGKT